MRALRVLLIILFCISLAGAASALSTMPVTGGDPYPMVVATVFIIVLIIGSYVVASWIARRKIDGLRRNGDIEGLVNALKTRSWRAGPRKRWVKSEMSGRSSR